ncbi:aldolase [Sphingomonas sp. SUN019]|uniref:HPr kinase/phosphorylase n=1 Tax=Sphingomonas sp. SUN019 TaxID=2937788 RepID=UPI002164DADF|nr:aldolase [Sphingomonas sp. SUN019]UVO49191.1 aldolase [Sphingomonas sp. SUN019]
MTDRETIHATTVAIDGRAVLISGPSGSGKSDLALRLIDRGATLVSDDYTEVRRDGDGLIAAPPATIAGRIEVRGIGIVPFPHLADAKVALAVRLGGPVERLPERGRRVIAGVSVREVAVDAFAATAPIKCELALREDLP